MTADPRAGGGQPRFRVLTISSNKGGVGKTTFACNLAIYLRALREDLPVLLLSFDDEPMLDRMFAIGDEQPSETIVTGFRQGSLAGAIRLGQYGVHYVPSSKQVAELKSEITSQSALWQVLQRTDWDGLVIIDTKSDFEILTQNAIAASDILAVIVSDHASLLESRRVFELFDEWGRPHQRARILLSLVDLRIKFREGESTDILAVLLGEVRRRGYPLFETFVSRSPVVEALYTNPDQRAHAILHRAPASLIHKQMHLLATDVLEALDEVAPQVEAADPEMADRPRAVPRDPPQRARDRLVRQRRLLRTAALAASILLPLALFAAWWQIDTPAEPAVAVAANREAWDFEQWRQQTVDALLETLDEDDSDRYLETIGWLSELDPEQTADVLIGRLAEAERSEDPVGGSRRRALAAQALGMVSGARAVGALRAALASDEPEVRLAAAKSLQQIRGLQQQARALGKGP